MGWLNGSEAFSPLSDATRHPIFTPRVQRHRLCFNPSRHFYFPDTKGSVISRNVGATRARVCTRERGRGRRSTGSPRHAAGQGSTFASRVHIIPGMFAKSTCRRKMNARGSGGRMHFVAHWYSRALPFSIVYLVLQQKKNNPREHAGQCTKRDL